MQELSFMLDVETLGTKPGAVVLSVGCAAFDRDTGKIWHTFNRPIALKSSYEAGLKIDLDTLTWWLKQDPGAIKNAFLDPRAKNLSFVSDDFRKWYHKHRTKNSTVWAQGMDFDGPIWARAMHVVGHETPWEFWALRDTRTVYDVAGLAPKSVPRKGTHHDALDDCKHQIKCLMAALSMLGDGTTAPDDEDNFLD